MEDVTLQQQELARLHMLNNVLGHHIPIGQAAEILGVSERHTRRLLAAYRKEGAAALLSHDESAASACTIRRALRAGVITLLSLAGCATGVAVSGISSTVAVLASRSTAVGPSDGGEGNVGASVPGCDGVACSTVSGPSSPDQAARAITARATPTITMRIQSL